MGSADRDHLGRPVVVVTGSGVLTSLGAGNLQFSSDDRVLFFSGLGNILYRLAIDPVQGVATARPPEPEASATPALPP